MNRLLRGIIVKKLVQAVRDTPWLSKALHSATFVSVLTMVWTGFTASHPAVWWIPIVTQALGQLLPSAAGHPEEKK
jgi:hypothetical protein